MVVVLPSTSMQCIGHGSGSAAGSPVWVVANSFYCMLVPARRMSLYHDFPCHMRTPVPCAHDIASNKRLGPRHTTMVWYRMPLLSFGRYVPSVWHVAVWSTLGRLYGLFVVVGWCAPVKTMLVSTPTSTLLWPLGPIILVSGNTIASHPTADKGMT